MNLTYLKRTCLLKKEGRKRKSQEIFFVANLGAEDWTTMGNLQTIKTKAAAEYERVRRETGYKKNRDYLVRPPTSSMVAAIP